MVTYTCTSTSDIPGLGCTLRIESNGSGRLDRAAGTLAAELRTTLTYQPAGCAGQADACSDVVIRGLRLPDPPQCPP